jgi:penicillin-insensitive murein DD-endopeptidase
MAVPIQPQDRRGYFMLPQAPEDAGYYVYGNKGGVPGTGHLAQYAHPELLSYIFYIEREWKAICDRKFGIGNISVDGGAPYDKHATHQKGVEMDCRPVRKDKITGPNARVSYWDPHYDLDATIALLALFARHPETRVIYFNDKRVQKAIGGGRVRTIINHNDHFHIEIKRRR